MNPLNFQAAIEVVRAVGDELESRYSSLDPIVDNNAMTAAFQALDADASSQLRQALAASYPDIAWLDGELEGAGVWRTAGAGRFWVCDAIDGAVQFLRRIPHWCVSLALIEDGAATATIVYDAMHRELFHAVAGAGAWCNGERLRVNERQSHRGALLATSQPPFSNDDDFVVNGSTASLGVALREAGAVRNLGPTSLQIAYVASGRLDAFWEYGEDTFNCLGGALLVSEAGGVATDVSGRPYGLASNSIVAAPAPVHRSLMASFGPSIAAQVDPDSDSRA
jgi:myo-inositol-1(or 4)-monophosphatase